jgi:hypothetical protein
MCPPYRCDLLASRPGSRPWLRWRETVWITGNGSVFAPYPRGGLETMMPKRNIDSLHVSDRLDGYSSQRLGYGSKGMEGRDRILRS